MPELPEVEVVRRGLQAHVAGKSISAVRVNHPRAVRRHEAGAGDLTARLLGARITGTGRRGKYLWLNLADEPLARRGSGSDEVALVVHLGMSGQLLLQPSGAADERHLRVRIGLQFPADDSAASSVAVRASMPTFSRR